MDIALQHGYCVAACWSPKRGVSAAGAYSVRCGVKPVGGSGRCAEDLRHYLDETNGVINILERASRELTTIMRWDEAVRKNPLRQRQLSLIGEQLAIARGRQSSIASMIAELEARPSSHQATEPGRTLMQIDDGRSIETPATPDEVDDLLRGRMKIPGWTSMRSDGNSAKCLTRSGEIAGAAATAKLVRSICGMILTA